MKKTIERIISYLLPRLGELFFAAIFAAAIAIGPRMMNVDGDLGRHITLGEYVLSSRSIPTTDPFSFSKYGDPLTPHEWLSDVFFSLAHQAAGLDGVVWLTALILGISFWLLYKHSLNLTNLSILALVGGIAGAAAGSIHWLTRPHIFTILMTAIWSIELEKVRMGFKKGWVIFPVLMVIWANLHGAFIAGLVIWGAVFLGELLEEKKDWNQLRLLIWIGLSSLLASLLNPDGLGIWKTGFGFLGNQYLVSHTAEYLPPDFQNPAFWPFLILIGVSFLLLGLSKKRMQLSRLFLLGGWTAMALYSARNIPLYVIVVIPILADLTANILKEGREQKWIERFLSFQHRLDLTEKQIRGGVLGIVVVLGSIFFLYRGQELDFQGQGNEFSADVFPVAAVDWLEENPQEGNGFNYFPWGGYLLYRRWPDQLVFIDGQTDFYGEDLTRQYEHVITLREGWEDVFLSYDIRWVIMPADAPLSGYLVQAAGWDLIYHDQTANLFTANGEE